MKKLLLPLIASAALAVPASAFAWGGGHDHHRGDFRFGGFGALTKLDGTGTSFGSNSATASGTDFTASLATTWSSAQSKTFADTDGDNDDSTATTVTVSCAPSTASITLSGQAATSYTGRTCSWTLNGTTKYRFFGSATDGTRAFLREDGTTVQGVVFKFDEGFQPGFGDHH